MSTLQVANVHLESTGNNRIQYAGSNSFTAYAGGVGTLAVNTTAIAVTGNANAVNITATANINMAVANITSNTLTLGTSSITANGFSRLPNGLLYQWGSVVANSTTASFNLPTSFTTAVYSVTATANNTTPIIGVTTANTTQLTIRTPGATSYLVFWMAIGV